MSEASTGGSGLRERVLGAGRPRLQSVEIYVSAWGGPVRISELSAGDRDAFETQHLKADGADFGARLVAWCVRDDQGERVFSDADIAELAQLPARVIVPIRDACVRVAGLTADEVETLEGN